MKNFTEVIMYLLSVFIIMYIILVACVTMMVFSVYDSVPSILYMYLLYLPQMVENLVLMKYKDLS